MEIGAHWENLSSLPCKILQRNWPFWMLHNLHRSQEAMSANFYLLNVFGVRQRRLGKVTNHAKLFHCQDSLLTKVLMNNIS